MTDPDPLVSEIPAERGQGEMTERKNTNYRGEKTKSCSSDTDAQGERGRKKRRRRSAQCVMGVPQAAWLCGSNN